MRYLGIDISQDELVVAYLSDNEYHLHGYSNSPSGIKKLLKTIDPSSDHCVMEATGTYGHLLMYQMSKLGYPLSVVNPIQIKRFAQMMLSTTKTDTKDAKLIALYGQRMRPSIYKLPDSALLQLKHKRTLLRQLKKQKVALDNMEHAFHISPYVDKMTRKTLSQTKTYLANQIKKLKEEIVQVADEQYRELMKRVTSIAGIGKQVAAALIELTNGFKDFATAKKFSRFIGLCPTYYQSGKSLKVRGGIARSGDPDLRSLLYMCALTSIKYNQCCQQFYQRLKERGKPTKVAIIAVANKLLRQVFAVVKQNTFFINGYVSELSHT